MRKLLFGIGREVFNIRIENREIFYADRKTKLCRLIPEDENIKRLVIMGRNKIPKAILEFFQLKKEEKEQYENAKTEDELAEICIIDCKKKGGNLLKDEKT